MYSHLPESSQADAKKAVQALIGSDERTVVQGQRTYEYFGRAASTLRQAALGRGRQCKRDASGALLRDVALFPRQIQVEPDGRLVLSLELGGPTCPRGGGGA